MIKNIKEDLISKAIDFAKDVHKGQTRKVSGLPYFTHPYAVYKLCMQLGLDKRAQIIALLHDTYEDGPDKDYIKNYIIKNFGNTIWDYVNLLSHEAGNNYYDYLLRIAKMNNVAINVKLCDMISNLKDSPSVKQLNKYRTAYLLLKQNKININTKIDNILSSIFSKLKDIK